MSCFCLFVLVSLGSVVDSSLVLIGFDALVLFVIVVCACFRCDLGPRFPLGFLRVFAVRSSFSIV